MAMNSWCFDFSITLRDLTDGVAKLSECLQRFSTAAYVHLKFGADDDYFFGRPFSPSELTAVAADEYTLSMRRTLPSDRRFADARVNELFVCDSAMNALHLLDDSDDDNALDAFDAFPSDPYEYKDTDADGVGNNADVFPFDATETKDSDGDGVGDNADVFPNDAAETSDTDLDGGATIAMLFRMIQQRAQMLIWMVSAIIRISFPMTLRSR